MVSQSGRLSGEFGKKQQLEVNGFHIADKKRFVRSQGQHKRDFTVSFKHLKTHIAAKDLGKSAN